MTIHLPKDLESIILVAVHSGRYASLDEAMAEAAALLVERLKHEQGAEPAASPSDTGARHETDLGEVRGNRCGHSERGLGQNTCGQF